MGLLILLQVTLDLAFIAIATLILMERSKSKSMEDPRLSRGLQLLSSKIAIIQDLMDRSESMTKQMGQFIEDKQQSIQESLEEAESHLHKIRKATEKSQDAVKMFKDGLPHHEMVERENTAKYVQAAKLANQGQSVDDISKKIDIPRGELDLIVKLNRNRLVTTDAPVATPIKPEVPSAVPSEGPAIPFVAKVANSGNKEASVRPVQFRKISADEAGLRGPPRDENP